MATRRAPGGTESRGRIVALLLLAVAVCGGGSVGFQDELFEGDPCQLESGTAGVCRRADSCGWLPGALRRRTEKIVNCGFDHEVAIVCCPSETVPVKLSSTEVAVRMCENSGDGLDFHILSGKKAANGEVPFIAALGYKVEAPEPGQPRYKWSCGSSLISPSFLLTAAHCVASSEVGSPVVARMGTLNLLNDADKDLQDRQVKNIIVHPDYKRKRYDDIALIEVDSGFGYDELVKPVCLGTSVKDMDSTRLLLVAGWGQMENGMTTPDMLFIANLTTVPNDECDKQFKSLQKNTKKEVGIRDSQYCAIGEQLSGLERVDTCQGDSGGPLYYTVNNKGVQKYVQVGVTSYGLNCGSPLPSVYTRVAHYLDWIVSHVWPEMAASA